MPTFTHGKDAVFKLQGAGGGAPTDLSPFLTAVDLEEDAELADIERLSRASVDFLVGQYRGTISLSGVGHPTPILLLCNIVGAKGFVGATFDAGAGFDFEYGPRGASPGTEKISGKCVLTSLSIRSGMAGAAEWEAQLATSSAITHGAW